MHDMHVAIATVLKFGLGLLQTSLRPANKGSFSIAILVRARGKILGSKL